MNIKLKQVSVDEKEILRNLLEKYNYEFSQYDLCDVNPLGLYGYGYLDNYWTEDNRWAYFILVDDKLAGFAMVNDYPEVKDEPMDFSLAEFFVMLKYRRKGIGKKAAFMVFDKHHGRWQLKRHPHNIPSVHFWDTVVSQYSDGNYRVDYGRKGTEYPDGTAGDILYFEN